MNNDRNGRALLWHALPFVAAMLLCLLAMQPATALFSKEKEEGADVSGAPIAQNQEIRVFRGVPYTGTLTAVDAEGGELSFAVVDGPEHGTLTVDGATFVYTPEEKRLGTDAFTFTATDSEGNTSEPASVKISVERSRSGVQYADMSAHSACTAAVALADEGVFIGAQVGDNYFFEPERSVSRGEFVAMALRAMDLSPDDITMTGFCDDESIPVWAKGYAVSALRTGVIRGVGTQEGIAFCSEDSITLNEAATVLNRLLDVTDVSLENYAGDVAAWSAQAVANLQSVSVIETGRFSPEDMKRPLTRAEAAELLSAAMTLADGKSEGLFSGLFG